ncbi:MAG: hypothetical protein N7Q72_03635, partial [Spiroplasma sp. Tabriz.8]|nr:hypothetical protein [Spiroplasma sp. Tabriz.8]
QTSSCRSYIAFNSGPNFNSSIATTFFVLIFYIFYFQYYLLSLSLSLSLSFHFFILYILGSSTPKLPTKGTEKRNFQCGTYS